MSFGRALGLITHPILEWKSIRLESEKSDQSPFGHVVILALIPAVASYIGSTITGWQIAGGDPVRLTPTSAMILCVLFYIAMNCGVFIMGKFIDFFAGTYGVTDGKSRGYTLAAYAASPLFIAGVAAVYPSIWVVLLVGIAAMGYAVVLLYQGLPIVMGIPEERGFMFSSAVMTVGLVMLVSLFAATVIIWSVGFSPVYIE